jgi:hypothetical protein
MTKRHQHAANHGECATCKGCTWNALAHGRQCRKARCNCADSPLNQPRQRSSSQSQREEQPPPARRRLTRQAKEDVYYNEDHSFESKGLGRVLESNDPEAQAARNAIFHAAQALGIAPQNRITSWPQCSEAARARICRELDQTTVATLMLLVGEQYCEAAVAHYRKHCHRRHMKDCGWITPERRVRQCVAACQ